MLRDEEEALLFLIGEEFPEMRCTPFELPIVIRCATPVIPCEYTVHTWLHPFCDDPICPCHFVSLDNNEAYMTHIGEPYQAGLLTFPEMKRLFYGEQI